MIRLTVGELPPGPARGARRITSGPPAVFSFTRGPARGPARFARGTRGAPGPSTESSKSSKQSSYLHFKPNQALAGVGGERVL